MEGNAGRIKILLVGKDGNKSELEKVVGEEVTSEHSFFHYAAALEPSLHDFARVHLGLSATTRSARTDHLASKLKPNLMITKPSLC